MFDATPTSIPAFRDGSPNRKYAVWFLLDGVKGCYSAKRAMSKWSHRPKNHMVITNTDHELVVPILMSRAEYMAYFSPNTKQKPEVGVENFLQERYQKQQPQAKEVWEVKRTTIELGATYHPLALESEPAILHAAKGAG